jgi:hypothetical protein
LLPIGQKRFAKWLLRTARARHGFSEQQILAFLHTTAADLPRFLALTYRVNPEWQERFPQLDTGGRDLLRWLRAEFPKWRELRAVESVDIAPRNARIR